MKVDELYVNKGKLDIKTKNVTIAMLNQLFDYYKNGYKKILKEANEMENKELDDAKDKTI